MGASSPPVAHPTAAAAHDGEQRRDDESLRALEHILREDARAAAREDAVEVAQLLTRGAAATAPGARQLAAAPTAGEEGEGAAVLL